MSEKKAAASFLEEMDVESHNAATVSASIKSMMVLVGKEPEVHQEEILKLDGEILDRSAAFIELYGGGNSQFTEADLRGLFQLLHNLSVRQNEFCEKLWRRLKRPIVELVVSENAEAKTANVLAAVILQLVLNGCSFAGDEVLSLLKGLLRTILKDVNSEHSFPLICVKRLLLENVDDVLSDYQKLQPDERFLLVDVLTEEISEQLPEHVVRFAAAQFKSKATAVLTVLGRKQPVEPAELMKLLHFLCCTSHLDRFRASIQSDKSLLIDAIYLLRMVHDAGKEKGDGMFSSANKMSDIADREKMESDAVFGFKRDLVRLIGNMSCEHTENQDEVRENHGIELILDCSPLDGKNPYITQWVIFAVRNICLGNTDNQAVLHSISKTGKVNENLLSEIGVEIKRL